MSSDVNTPPVSSRLRSTSISVSLHSRSRSTVAPASAASSHKASSARPSKGSPLRPSARINTFTTASSAGIGDSREAAKHARLPLHAGSNQSASPSLSAATPQRANTLHTSKLLLTATSTSSELPEASQSSMAGVMSYSQAVVLTSERKASTSILDERSTRTASESSQNSARGDEAEDEGVSEPKADVNGSSPREGSAGPWQLRNGFGQVLSADRAAEPCAQQADVVCIVSLPSMPASPTSPGAQATQLPKEKYEQRSGATGAVEVDCHPFQPSAGAEDSDSATPLSSAVATPAKPVSPAAPHSPPHSVLQLSSVAAANSMSTSAASTSRSPTASSNQPLHSTTLSPTTAANRKAHGGRLPFLASPTSSPNAVATSAGPEGYLASLNPHVASPRVAHCAADPLLSSDAVTASASSQKRSPSVVVRSLRPFTLHRQNKHSTLPAEAKRATFFASVAHALGRMSLSQRRDGPGGVTGRAELAARRPSLSSLMPVKPTTELSPPLPLLKTGEEVTEVTAMSPHFNPRSPSPAQPGSPDLPTPTAASSAASPTSAAASATRHFNHLTPGNYSHNPYVPFQPYAPASRPVPATSATGELDEALLESWSESDDPLSPASFQQIVPGVYLGSAKSVMNVDRLLEHRITHVLTVMNRPLNFLARAGDARDADILSFTVQRDASGAMTSGSCPPSQVPSAHPLFGGVMHALTTHFVYLLDLPEADLLSALHDCIPYLLHAHQRCGGRVLIHCQAGISRSASVVIAYLVRLYGWSVRQAYEVCYEARPYIHPNEGFVSQLELYARADERRRRKERRRWREWMRRDGWLKGGGGKQRWWNALSEDVKPRLLPAEASVAPAAVDKWWKKHGDAG